MINDCPVPGPYGTSEEAFCALQAAAPAIRKVGYTHKRVEIDYYARDAVDVEAAAKSLGIRLHNPEGRSPMGRRRYIDVMQHKNLFNDPVGRALENVKIPLLMGRIENLDDVFSNIYYTEFKIDNDPPRPGAKKFTLILDGVRGVWWDAKEKLHLTVEMTPKLADVVRQHLGTAVNVGFDKFTQHPVSSFSLIAWKNQDVALLKINRPDHSSFLSYVGLIALSNIPAFSPVEPQETAETPTPGKRPYP